MSDRGRSCPWVLNESRFKLKLKLEDSSSQSLRQSRFELLFPTRTQRARIFSEAFQPHFGHAVKGCGDEFPHPRYCHCMGDTQRDAVSGGWGWRSRMDDGIDTRTIDAQDAHNSLSPPSPATAQVLLLLPPRLPRCLDDADACEPRQRTSKMRTVCHACHEL